MNLSGLPGLNDLTNFFYNNNNAGNNATPSSPVIPDASSAGLLGNYDDQVSWSEYLKLLESQNAVSSAEAEKNRLWNEKMRDSQVSSYMRQLRENGINPILAVQSGYSGASYPSSATGQAYSGTSPYSNSSRVDSAIIRALGSFLGDIVSSAFSYFGKINSSEINGQYQLLKKIKN